MPDWTVANASREASGADQPFQGMIEGITFYGDKAGFADQAVEMVNGHLLMGACANAFGNVLPEDGAIYFVAAPG